MGFQLRSGNRPKLSGGVLTPKCEPNMTITMIEATPLKDGYKPGDNDLFMNNAAEQKAMAEGEVGPPLKQGVDAGEGYMPEGEAGPRNYKAQYGGPYLKTSPYKEDDDDDGGDDDGGGMDYEPQTQDDGGNDYEPQAQDADTDTPSNDGGGSNPASAGKGQVGGGEQTDGKGGATDAAKDAVDGEATDGEATDGEQVDGEQPPADGEEPPAEEPPPGERDLSKLTGAEREAEYDARGWAHDETIDGYEAPEEVDAVGQPTMTETEKIEESVKSESEKMDEAHAEKKEEDAAEDPEAAADEYIKNIQEGVDPDQAAVDAQNIKDLGKDVDKFIEKKLPEKIEKKLWLKGGKQAAKLLAKHGGKAGLKALGKMSARLIPGVGTAMLIHDGVKLASWGWKNRDKIASWAGKQKSNMQNKMNEWMT